MRTRGRAKRIPARGFTLVEMILAGFLMGLLGLLLANAWAAFGRPAISAVARAKLAQEANLAAEAIARDVGMLARSDSPGADSRYQNVRAEGPKLYLHIDDGTGRPRYISYAIDPNPDDPGKLVRTDPDNPDDPPPVEPPARTPWSRGSSRTSRARPARCPSVPGGRRSPASGLISSSATACTSRDRDGTYRGDHTRLYTLVHPGPLMMTRRRRRRPGYAMVIVVLFVLLFLGLWGRAARQVGSMIRIEEARARRVRRRQSSPLRRVGTRPGPRGPGGGVSAGDAAHDPVRVPLPGERRRTVLRDHVRPRSQRPGAMAHLRRTQHR